MSGVSGILWSLALLFHWIVDTNRSHYDSFQPGQTVAYVSDAGANQMKPLFIVGAIVTSVTFDIFLILRSQVAFREYKRGQKILSTAAVIFSFAGTLGFCAISIFDVRSYRPVHEAFLSFFLVAYIIMAALLWAELFWGNVISILRAVIRTYAFYSTDCWIKQRSYALVRVHLTLILAEASIGFAFMFFQMKHMWDLAAYLEWGLTLLFFLYIMTFSLE